MPEARLSFAKGAVHLGHGGFRKPIHFDVPDLWGHHE
jgi:hypothetical protein